MNHSARPLLRMNDPEPLSLLMNYLLSETNISLVPLRMNDLEPLSEKRTNISLLPRMTYFAPPLMEKEFSKRRSDFIHDAERIDADANGLHSRRQVPVWNCKANYKNRVDPGKPNKYRILLFLVYLGTVGTALSFLPCAGGICLGSSQSENRDHSEIYQSTLRYLSDCPSPMEYMGKTLEKCADACGSYIQDGHCAYHCMRDSSKTRIVEFCAKPKILFEYCPEYDPVDQTIQKDMATLCNSTYTRHHYNSSDIYFCDSANCLRLHESTSVRSGATTLTTLMNGTTETNSGETQERQMVLFVITAALDLVIVGCVFYFFFQYGFSFERIRKMTEKRNRDGLTYEYVKEYSYAMRNNNCISSEQGHKKSFDVKSLQVVS